MKAKQKGIRILANFQLHVNPGYAEIGVNLDLNIWSYEMPNPDPSLVVSMKPYPSNEISSMNCSASGSADLLQSKIEEQQQDKWNQICSNDGPANYNIPGRSIQLPEPQKAGRFRRFPCRIPPVFAASDRFRAVFDWFFAAGFLSDVFGQFR